MKNGLIEPTVTDPRRWWGLGEVLGLAVPGVLNMVSLTAMQFVDGWMVSKISPGTLAAQFLGGMVAFVPVCFFMGLLACVNTFAAQNLGARRPERSAVYGWQGLWLALAAWAMMLMLIPLGPALFGLFGHAPNVAAMETTYFRILVGGAGFFLSARAMGAFFLGIHKPVLPLIAGVVGNAVNVAMNYLLIFGKFGFPRLGLAGAGIGTVIGSGVEATILLGFFLAGPIAARFRVRSQCRFAWGAIKDLLRIGSPSGLTFVSDILMWTIFMGCVIGGFGTAHLAAAAILNRYWHLCFMPALGISSASTAIVGRYCGARRPGLAWRRAHAALVLVQIYMVTTGLVAWLNRDALVGLFNSNGDPDVQAIATRAFIVILVCQAFDALSVVSIGSLRGAGDTLWPGVVQACLSWGLGLGGSSLVAYLKPEWGSFGPWGASCGYICLLGVVMWVRFLRGRWRQLALVAPPPAAPPEEAPGAPPPV